MDSFDLRNFSKEWKSDFIPPQQPTLLDLFQRSSSCIRLKDIWEDSPTEPHTLSLHHHLSSRSGATFVYRTHLGYSSGNKACYSQSTRLLAISQGPCKADIWSLLGRNRTRPGPASCPSPCRCWWWLCHGFLDFGWTIAHRLSCRFHTRQYWRSFWGTEFQDHFL